MLNKRLGDAIRQFIQKSAKSQKEVAGAFADRMGLSISTVSSDLSELVTGKPGSERKFFGAAEQTSALADALGTSLEALRELFERCKKGRYLVLDPTLDSAVREFLLRQQASSEAAYECIEVTGNGNLRETAKAVFGCIVVLQNDADRAFYEGADIKVTKARAVPRGLELVDLPGVVPIPPPTPARAWVNGAPMFSHPELVADVRREAAARGLDAKKVAEAHRHAYSYERRGATEKTGWLSELQPGQVIDLAKALFTSDATGDEPSFPLATVLPWLEARAGGSWRIEMPQASRDRCHGESIPMTFEQAEGSSKSTTLWWLKDRLFALGPSAEALGDALRPRHNVESPASLQAWREALKTRNPFGDAFDSLIQAAADEAGLSLKEATNQWAREVNSGGSSYAKATTVRIEASTPEAEHAARATIAALAGRAMVVPDRDQTLSLRLRLASLAPLALLEKKPFDAVHVLASVGAGRVLRIRIAQFEGAGKGELRVYEGDRDLLVLDGDGTHAWVESSYDAELEGMFVRARARRAEEKARASDDYDD